MSQRNHASKAHGEDNQKSDVFVKFNKFEKKWNCINTCVDLEGCINENYEKR